MYLFICGGGGGRWIERLTLRAYKSALRRSFWERAAFLLSSAASSLATASACKEEMISYTQIINLFLNQSLKGLTMRLFHNMKSMYNGWLISLLLDFFYHIHDGFHWFKHIITLVPFKATTRDTVPCILEKKNNSSNKSAILWCVCITHKELCKGGLPSDIDT